MKINCLWRTTKHPKPDIKLLENAAVKAAELAGLDMSFEWILDLQFVGDRAMAAANSQYVGHQGTTDVITFSYFDSEEPVFPGDVGIELIICTDVAAREGAARADSSYADELMLYLVHGLLHSSGEDDLTDEAAKSMRRREAEVLAGLTPIFDFFRIFPE